MVWNVGGSNEERFPMKNRVIRGLERRKTSRIITINTFVRTIR